MEIDHTDYKEISKAVKGYYESTDDNVVSVGYGLKQKNGKLTEEKVIVFTVKEKKNLSEISPDKILPREIKIRDGFQIKTDVVQQNFKLLSSLCGDPSPLPSNRNKLRPLRGGISISNFSVLSDRVGTFGFVAIDDETNSLVGVTNGHVIIDDQFICSDRDPEGQVTNVFNHQIVQPNEFGNSSASNSIGIVKKYLPITNNAYNYADVAVFTVKKEDLDESISFTQEGLNYNFWLPFATTEEIDNLLNTNPDLFSSGRTSGARGEDEIKLKVYQLAANVYVNLNLQGQPTSADFADSIAFKAFDFSLNDAVELYCPVNPGDSGSALIADIDGIRKIIGLVFAAGFDEFGNITTGLANRIDRISDLIKISAWNGELLNCEESDTSNLETYSSYFYNDKNNLLIDDKFFWQVGLKSDSSNLPVGAELQENIQQPLFNKSSFLGVPSPYLSYLNQSVDRWSTYIKYNSSVYSYIKEEIDENFSGIYLLPLVSSNPYYIPNGLTLFNDSSDETIAYCGVYNFIDLVEGPSSVKFNTLNFFIGINEYYKDYFSPSEWVGIMTHELGHALGIGNFWDPDLSDLGSVAPSAHFLDGGAYLNAMSGYNDIINNSQNYTKIPLEDIGGDGTAGGHWENSFRPASYPNGDGLSYPGLKNELMIGFISPNLKISRLSIGALLDFGYEEVNPGASEGYIDLIDSSSAFSASSLNLKKFENCQSKLNIKPKSVGKVYL